MKGLALSGLLVVCLSMVLPGESLGAEAGRAPRFGLRLNGGLGYSAVGDLSSGLEGFGDAAADNGGVPSGEYQEVHSGPELGVDLVYQINRTFGVGIGSGYLRASSTSDIQLVDAVSTVQWTYEPVVSAVPVRLSAIALVPLGDRVSLTAQAGVGCYFGFIRSHIRSDRTISGSDWQDEASGRGLGIHGGLGIEVRITKNLFLSLEGQGRYAEIKELTGERTFSQGGGYVEETEGTLYYWTDLYTFSPHPNIGISANQPAEAWIQDARKAVLDLSGGCVLVGVIVRF